MQRLVFRYKNINLLLFIATIKFDQSVYFAAENDRIAHPSIILQRDVLGSHAITVEMFSTDGSAIGDCDVIIILLYD